MEQVIAYHDEKRYAWLYSVLIPPLLPVAGAALWWWSGYAVWLWLPMFVYYVVYPVLDAWQGEDQNNPPESAVKQLETDPYYRYLTYCIIPLQYATFIGAAWLLATQPVGAFGYLGTALSLGTLGGIAINTGHELGHKKGRLERFLAKLSLIQVGYGHFYVEHNRGHHKDVATPEDPASSRMGESLYAFMWREVPGAAKRAWKLEATRLERMGKSRFSLDNDIVQTTLGTALFYAVIIAAFGAVIIPFLLIQMAYGYFQLTLANYVEHYGLLRGKLADGRYERVRPEHSWNSNHVVTNLVLFHLQRHSDHHANPTRRYQALRHFDDTPQLPSGYALMFLLAQVPPLWRWVMDRRLMEHVGYDMDRVNVDPAQRERLYARYHHPLAQAA